MKKTRLKIAVQKKGRLNNDCLDLFRQCGLQIRVKDSALFTHCENLPIDLWFVRDDDIPNLVAEQLCDVGIVGENVLYESQDLNSPNIEIMNRLGFSNCRLSIAVPLNFDYQSLASLENCRVATSYPNLVRQYFSKKSIPAEIITISGSVEIAPRLEMADAICDLVSTGSTLEENHLKEVETILRSEAVFIKTAAVLEPSKQETLELLCRRMNGVIQAQDCKYIMFHAPREALPAIKAVLPGCESPTIVSLEGTQEKVAVHLVSREGVFWGTLEKLKAVGASHILVMPIEKMLV